MDTIMVNHTFSVEDIAVAGLKKLDVAEISAKIFEKDDMVYLFDQTDPKHYRLFSVIHKRSFFL